MISTRFESNDERKYNDITSLFREKIKNEHLDKKDNIPFRLRITKKSCPRNKKNCFQALTLFYQKSFRISSKFRVHCLLRLINETKHILIKYVIFSDDLHLLIFNLVLSQRHTKNFTTNLSFNAKKTPIQFLFFRPSPRILFTQLFSEFQFILYDISNNFIQKKAETVVFMYTNWLQNWNQSKHRVGVVVVLRKEFASKQ